MIYKISAKITLFFMSIAMLFNNMMFKTADLGSGGEMNIVYEFDNDTEYSAAGTVSISDAADREYDLYWGDGNGDILTVSSGGKTARYGEFATVEVESGKGEADVYDFTVIPNGAETVLVYHGKFEVASIELPENKKPAKETADYSFGVLSDVHFNRYRLSLTDDAMINFPNALDFFDAFGVKLVGISGDISNKSERNSFEKYNSVVSEYDFPVYTCTGNHDVGDEFSQSVWNELVNTDVYGDTKAPGVVEVADNNLDFVYAPDGEDGDIFLFLSQYQWSYRSDDSRLLTDAQLDWFEQQLQKYKDNTVFLFFHTFLANDDDDDPYSGVGNLINNSGVYYKLMYTRGTVDEVRFRSLLKEYKNVVFFSGHSHFAFAMQKYNERINISDFDGEYCTMVHVPSVNSPRTVTADSSDYTETMLRYSEGYLVNVYPDRIVLNGVDFYSNEVLSYASYVIER